MSNRCLNFTVTEKLFFKNLPGTRGPLHSGAPWTLPTLPTPLLRHCLWGVGGAGKRAQAKCCYVMRLRNTCMHNANFDHFTIVECGGN